MKNRALRKVRRAKRMAAVTSINLVSMIDIFTILIIYLLVNTAAVQIAGAEQVDLPKSTAEEPPRQNVAVIVTASDILLNGAPVMKVDAAKATTGTLKPLQDQLLAAAPLTARQQQSPGEEGGEVNILADKSIPYSLLKRVMATCAEARFGKISLGVLPVKG
ncbi:MAG TPA: biopolymer transporter ExbD [Candidatus Binatia bacterium]|nr:biopolymer transporter ExbD [Candidatus Binatia bacterium]